MRPKHTAKPDTTFLSQNGDLNILNILICHPRFTIYRLIIIIIGFFFFLGRGICSYTHYTVFAPLRHYIYVRLSASILAKTTAGSLRLGAAYIGNQEVKYVWSMKLIRHFFCFERVSPGHSLANPNFYLIDNVCVRIHTLAHNIHDIYTPIHTHTYTIYTQAHVKRPTSKIKCAPVCALLLLYRFE